MIRVVKPGRAPQNLRGPTSRGATATRKLEEAYDAGNRDFDFDSAIYAAKSVKRALIKAQHDKCCFCESRITHVDFGDVEHFRPKAGFRQSKSDPLSKPGYYWLAYDWSNLFLSCALCNQRYKGNLFPLADPSKRAKSHHDPLSNEEPLFIHPSDDDPGHYIGFREETPYAIGGNRRGRVTIRELGLDRPELDEMRRRRLAEARRYSRTVRLFRQIRERQGSLDSGEKALLEELEAALRECLSPAAEYSAVLRAALREDVP